MTERTLPWKAESLLEYQPFVDTLARRLLNDGTEADDVAQQTWLSVLQRPPSDPHGLRPWLGRVVRNKAADLRTNQSRRAAHEREAGRIRTGEPVDSVVARMETRRLLVAAVLDLPEPFRSTIAYRFYEGFPPREISRRMNVPVETVRSRTRLALDKLRTRLEERDEGDWRAALGFLLQDGSSASAVGHTASGTSSVTVTSAMTSWIAIVVSCGVAATLALYLWPDPNSDDSTSSGTVASVTMADPPPIDPPKSASAPIQAQREAVAAASPVRPPEAAPTTTPEIPRDKLNIQIPAIQFEDDDLDTVVNVLQIFSGIPFEVTQAALAKFDERGHFITLLSGADLTFGTLLEMLLNRLGEDFAWTYHDDRFLLSLEEEVDPSRGTRLRPGADALPEFSPPSSIQGNERAAVDADLVAVTQSFLTERPDPERLFEVLGHAGAVASSQAGTDGPGSPFRRIGSWTAESGRVTGRFEIERVGQDRFCWIWRHAPKTHGTLSPEIYVAFSQRNGAIRVHEMSVAVPNPQFKKMEQWQRDQLAGDLGGYRVQGSRDGLRFTPLRLKLHPGNEVLPVSKEMDLDGVTERAVSATTLEPWLKHLGAYVMPESR